jgi:hypothetical protein
MSDLLATNESGSVIATHRNGPGLRFIPSGNVAKQDLTPRLVTPRQEGLLLAARAGGQDQRSRFKYLRPL